MCYPCPQTILLPLSPDRTAWAANNAMQRTVRYAARR